MNVISQLYRSVNLSEGVELLKTMGYTVCSATTDGDTLDNHNLRLDGDKIALVLGSEGQGIKQKILDVSDKVISIPMNSSADSLNVSQAGAILMHHFYSA